MLSQAKDLLPVSDGEPGKKFTPCQSLVPGRVALSLTQQEHRSSWGKLSADVRTVFLTVVDRSTGSKLCGKYISLPHFW